LHHKYSRSYGGMNQSSLGCLLETRPDLAKLVTRLECQDVNCVEPWRDWDQAALVHVKGSVQRHLFGNRMTAPHRVREVAMKWLSLERETKDIE
jgi:hypothetical protein